DVDVERIEAHAAVRTHRVREGDRLIGAIQKIGLEAIQGLQPEHDALRFTVRVHFFQTFDAPLPFFFGRRHRCDFADLRRHDGHFAAVEFAHHPHNVFDVLDRAFADFGTRVNQIASGEHERHTAPAAQFVFFEQFADFFGVVLVRLATDFDAVVAEMRQTTNRDFNRLGAHPVVHRKKHGHPPLGISDFRFGIWILGFRISIFVSLPRLRTAYCLLLTAPAPPTLRTNSIPVFHPRIFPTSPYRAGHRSIQFLRRSLWLLEYACAPMFPPTRAA